MEKTSKITSGELKEIQSKILILEKNQESMKSMISFLIESLVPKINDGIDPDDNPPVQETRDFSLPKVKINPLKGPVDSLINEVGKERVKFEKNIKRMEEKSLEDYQNSKIEQERIKKNLREKFKVINMMLLDIKEEAQNIDLEPEFYNDLLKNVSPGLPRPKKHRKPRLKKIEEPQMLEEEEVDEELNSFFNQKLGSLFVTEHKGSPLLSYYEKCIDCHTTFAFSDDLNSKIIVKNMVGYSIFNESGLISDFKLTGSK